MANYVKYKQVEIEKIKEDKGECYVCLWLYDDYREYKDFKDFLNDDIQHLDRRLHHIRIFNEDEEYHYWRNKDGEIDGRYRKDVDAVGGLPYDHEEEKKIVHYMHEENLMIDKRKSILIRNYYDENGFIDLRYAKILSK